MDEEHVHLMDNLEVLERVCIGRKCRYIHLQHLTSLLRLVNELLDESKVCIAVALLVHIKSSISHQCSTLHTN